MKFSNQINYLHFVGARRNIFFPFALEQQREHGRGVVQIEFIGDDFEYKYLPYPDCASSSGDFSTDTKINELVENYDPLNTVVFMFGNTAMSLRID